MGAAGVAMGEIAELYGEDEECSFLGDDGVDYDDEPEELYFLQGLWEKFHAKVVTDDNSGCHLWVGNINEGGYGVFRSGYIRSSIAPAAWLAHRAAYALDNEHLVPDDMTIDHTCMVRCCVNPEHLEMVTRVENYNRMVENRKNGIYSKSPCTCRKPSRSLVLWLKENNHKRIACTMHYVVPALVKGLQTLALG